VAASVVSFIKKTVALKLNHFLWRISCVLLFNNVASYASTAQRG